MKKRLIDDEKLSNELIADALLLEIDDGSDGEPDEVEEVDIMGVLLNE